MRYRTPFFKALCVAAACASVAYPGMANAAVNQLRLSVRNLVASVAPPQAAAAPSLTVLAQPSGCGVWVVELGANTNFDRVLSVDALYAGRPAPLATLNYSVSGSTLTVDWGNTTFSVGGRPALCGNGGRPLTGTATLQFVNPQGEAITLSGAI